jgi:hypothetical protein
MNPRRLLSFGDVIKLVHECDLDRVERVFHVLADFGRHRVAEVVLHVCVVVVLVEVGRGRGVFGLAAQDGERACAHVDEDVGRSFAQVLGLEDDPLAGLFDQAVGGAGGDGRADDDQACPDPVDDLFHDRRIARTVIGHRRGDVNKADIARVDIVLGCGVLGYVGVIDDRFRTAQLLHGGADNTTTNTADLGLFHVEISFANAGEPGPKARHLAADPATGFGNRKR